MVGCDELSLCEAVRLGAADCVSAGVALSVEIVGEAADVGSCRLRGVLSVAGWPISF